MEERPKSPMEMAAYSAGLELARRLAEEKQKREDEAKTPPATYVIPTTSYQNTKAHLN